MRKILIVMTLIILTISCSKEKGKYDTAWHSGWGQGVCEATVTSGKDKIYVSCDCGSGFDNQISISLQNTLAYNIDISFTFDELQPIIVHAASEEDGVVAKGIDGKKDFETILQLFEKHSRVKVEYPDGKQATFTLKGSQEALEGCHS